MQNKFDNYSMLQLYGHFTSSSSKSAIKIVSLIGIGVLVDWLKESSTCMVDVSL